MAGVPTISCSECPRLLAVAATARRQHGLAPLSPYSATCSNRCEGRRDARFRREARERGFRLAPGDWRCDECGCVAEEAVARRAREGRSLPAGVMVVCSPECYRARVNRRTAALMREKQRTPAAKERRQMQKRGGCSS